MNEEVVWWAAGCALAGLMVAYADLDMLASTGTLALSISCWYCVVRAFSAWGKKKAAPRK